MKFSARISPLVKTILWMIFVVSAIGTILGILLICGVPIPYMGGVDQGKIFATMCPFPAILSVLFATTHYKVTDTHLQMRLGFIDILGGRVAIENILNIVVHDNKLYISYIWKGVDPVIAQISISPAKYDQFRALLVAKNPLIVYYNDDEQRLNQTNDDTKPD